MTLIYKICDIEVWRAAERAGTFAGAGIDLTDGYVHFSAADQVAETATRHFAGQRNLVLVAVDADALGRELKWVRFVKPLPLGFDGLPLLPDLSD
jgi:uncharacterized protein (DUF952 family)